MARKCNKMLSYKGTGRRRSEAIEDMLLFIRTQLRIKKSQLVLKKKKW